MSYSNNKCIQKINEIAIQIKDIIVKHPLAIRQSPCKKKIPHPTPETSKIQVMLAFRPINNLCFPLKFIKYTKLLKVYTCLPLFKSRQ